MDPNWKIDRLAGHDVLFVMAADAEYGPCLRDRISPLMTGVGPVEAAIVMTAALSELRAADRMPDLVVSLGSAGSRRLEQTRIYQVSSVEYRDMDASVLGFPKGVTPFLDLPARIDLPIVMPTLPRASLATGASVVSGQAYEMSNADMVDMETFAILRACQRFDVPLVGLRGISDGAGDVTAMSDWTQYLLEVDEGLAKAVDILSLALTKGDISLG